ncbi:MAG: hypothetical protein CMP05_07735 [Xanthomarina sp.]|jgi:hypothetical protein|uniref:Uncharacterized protein n=1 Tax=Xanthomarina gelatinilytica TaxID=1137281 RepID=A0A3C0F041_9FLAO|nr:hypothetical protein [Xanthomarina sp.]MCB0387997.1 hypothetical protein [Winogradskyella sp.]HAI16931.1 hypothetical protein [Xanthomarina gelatinilytica]MAL23523.1 hypothetical protein [Xanthomarina sp.]MBF61877.1 hypothetical protein [Xanthomarina sp.]HCY81631.1 hypothetical protein [Xanthomarina gelatinilytica]|tara:strand:+ start:942 stop:1184 length:243 start_codon:yes stop_codon:yes gene_type:complete
MSQVFSLSGTFSLALIEQSSIVTALSISVIFFLVLLILGLRKSYLLRKESEKLSQSFSSDTDEETKVYKDFTESHLYDNN